MGREVEDQVGSRAESSSLACLASSLSARATASLIHTCSCLRSSRVSRPIHASGWCKALCSSRSLHSRSSLAAFTSPRSASLGASAPRRSTLVGGIGSVENWSGQPSPAPGQARVPVTVTRMAGVANLRDFHNRPCHDDKNESGLAASRSSSAAHPGREFGEDAGDSALTRARRGRSSWSGLVIFERGRVPPPSPSTQRSSRCGSTCLDAISPTARSTAAVLGLSAGLQTRGSRSSAVGRDKLKVRHHPHCMVLEDVAVVHPLAGAIVR